MLEQLFDTVDKNTYGSDSGSVVSFSDILDSAVSQLEGTGTDNLLSGLNTAASDTSASDAGNMTVSDNMVKFIEEHEGFSSTAYNGADSWNRTIGYGHVESSGENISSISKTDAEKLLRSDLKKYESSVNSEFAGVNLSQGQFDSLVSFAYNLGANIWSKTPKLTSDIKSGASLDEIKTDMENCSHCGGNVLTGLLKRRDDEWNVYAYGNYNL